MYTVNHLAKLSGVSIRTLHYYDQIGLLEPSFTKENGYRVYQMKELVKLQQILFFRELEFPLEQIKEILTSPGFDRIEALEYQKKLLDIKKQRLQEIISTIDKTVLRLKGGEDMKNDNNLYQGLSDAQIEELKKEAKQRWGHTEAYKQSIERTKHFTKEDYKRLAEDGNKHTQAIADLMDKGVGDEEVQDLIQKSHQGVNFFYDCSYEMFRNLGQMYVDDPRFTAYYEKFKPGLAVFMRDAIAYYCNQQEKKSR